MTEAASQRAFEQNNGAITGQASAVQTTTQAMSGVAQATIAACLSAVRDCSSACSKSWNKDIEGHSKPGDCKIEFGKNVDVAKEIKGLCYSEYGDRVEKGIAADAEAKKALAGAGKTKAAAEGGGSEKNEEGSWMQRNGWIPVAALMAGVGALAFFGSKGGGSQQPQQQNNNSPSPSPSPTSTTGTTGACAEDSSYNNPDCASQFVTACTANPTTTGCMTFTNYYCGFADNTASAVSGSGPGMTGTAKASYCRMAVSTRFCASNPTGCATCEFLTQLQKPICKTNIDSNPQLCSAQKSDAQIEAQKTACANDPVYAENGQNSILQLTTTDGTEVPVLPTGSTSTVGTTTPTGTSTTTTTTGTDAFTGRYYSSNTDSGSASTLAASSAKSGLTAALADRKIASADGMATPNYGSRVSYATASTYKGAESEVSESMGRNLFDKNTKTLQLWCKSVSCRSVNGAATQN